MGIFDKPIVTCSLCGKEIGAKEKRWKTKDGYMCEECTTPFLFRGSRAFIDDSTEELVKSRKNQVVAREFWANNTKKYKELNPTRNIENVLFIDDDKKKWYIKKPEEKWVLYLDENMRAPMVYKFADIAEINISLGDKIMTSTTVTRKDKGIRKAVAGGIIAGAPGAVIGGMMARGKANTQIFEVQSYFVNILIDGTKEPITLQAENENIAKELHEGFASIMPERVTKKDNEINPDISSEDELRKLKGLLDDGIITDEEFSAKKKQILGL